MTKKIVAIILAIAAILSFAACGKTAETTQEDTTNTTTKAVETTIVETVEEDDYVEIDWELNDEELQKQLCEILPEDGEIQISEDLAIERWNRSFYLRVKTPYVSEYLGSADVPADLNGWGWSGEHYVHHSEKGSYVLNQEKLQCWNAQELLWEVEIPSYSDYKTVRIENVYNDVVVVNNYSDSTLYIVYDGNIRIIGEDLYEVDANYSDLWWLTIDGRVYLLEDYGNNPTGEAELMADNAIALSENMSDGPGWYITGEANYRDDWTPVVGEFVPAP